MSAPPFRLVTYDLVRASPKRGCFRVLHPNDAVRRTGSLCGRLRARCFSFGDGITRRSASSQSARVHRRAPLCGGRLACRAVAPLRVVKMRRRSLRSSFLGNYREAHSFSLRVDTSGQERRTEGIAIVTRSVNRVRCPLKPWGPFGGNGRGPRRKYFRWGNLGGTRRRGLNLTPMSGEGSLFQTRGRKARMGLPAKCMHFVGSPGWRGKSR